MAIYAITQKAAIIFFLMTATSFAAIFSISFSSSNNTVSDIYEGAEGTSVIIKNVASNGNLNDG